MRWVVACGVAVLLAAGVFAHQGKPAKRYDIDPNLEKYPQATPKDTLASVLKALDAKRIDYLLAHLAEPMFVDRRVKEYGGKFAELVQETSVKLAGDPNALKDLRRFLKEGEWEEGEDGASVKLKDVTDRQVYFRKRGDRWFMENRTAKEPRPGKP